MTQEQLLARLNSHFATNSQKAANIFLPDLFPMIAPALHTITNRVKSDPEKRNLLIKEHLIPITAQRADGFWEADLSVAQAANLLTTPPFPQVSIGANIGAFYSAIPPAYDDGCQAFEDTYYIIGNKMIVETVQDLVVGTDEVAIIGYTVPTLATLPIELEDDMLDVIAEKLSALRQSQAREEK